MKEGIFTMKEVKRISIIQSVIDRKRTQKEASQALHITDRQIRNIIKRYKKEGAEGIKHKNKLNKPKHTFTKEFKDKVISLKLSKNYIDTNFSHFKDLLEEREYIKISYSGLYNILKENSIISKRKHKSKKTHRMRKRKESRGTLVQTDGTPYDWFNNGNKYSLHGYIDDATGEILGLYMCENECMMGYLEITRQMLKNHGSPVTIYSDKYSVFFPTCTQKITLEEELDGKEKPTTQFYRIMDSLGIEIIPASTSQAKGRVERLWNTLQDRLTQEFKIDNIKTIDEANVYLPSYIKRYNKKFAIAPSSGVDKFVPLPPYINLDILLASKMTRVIDCAGTFTIKNKKFQIVNNNILPRAKINIYVSHKIGIKVEYKEKWYNVICIDDIPSTYSTLNFNKLCKEYEYKVKEYAILLCSEDSKATDPLLVTS